MKADLHIHTKYSRCSNLEPEMILKIAKRRGLDSVAITDHNTQKGAYKAKSMSRVYDVKVIQGVEIDTNLGHVLGYDVNSKITKTDFFEVIDELKRQAAFIVIAHPFSTFRKFDLSKINNIGKYIDAIEGFNARTMFFWQNKKAQKFADKNNLGITGGSDGHFSFEIGNGLTYYEGDLFSAIKSKKTVVSGTTFYSFFGNVRTVLRKYL